MGPRKQTKKKAKKKKSNSKKDEWAFEGGQSLEQQGESNEDGKHRRRHTQDRDERLRRGRMKIADRRKIEHFRSKMQEKIKFKDFLVGQADEVQVSPPVERVKRVRHMSSIPVLDRLQFLVTSRLQKHNSSIDSPSSDDNSDESEDDCSGAGRLPIAEVDGENDDNDSSISENDRQTEAIHIPSDDEADDVVKSDSFNWFFSSDSFLNSLDDAPKRLLEFDNFEVHGKCTVDSFFRSIHRLSDISGLNKLWRSRCNQPVTDRIEGAILPYMTCFTDMFLEGRDISNDDKMLHATLLHICVHSVRSRAKVLKHNYKLKKRSEDLKLLYATAEASAHDELEAIVDAESSSHGADDAVETKTGRSSKRLKQIEPELVLTEGEVKKETKTTKGKKGASVATATTVTKAVTASVAAAASTTKRAVSTAMEAVAAPAPATAMSISGSKETKTEQRSHDLADTEEEVSAMQDQGFVRPRVLILCPFRGTAKQCVDSIIDILGPNTTVSSLPKLEDEFGNDDDDEDDDEDEEDPDEGGGGGSSGGIAGTAGKKKGGGKGAAGRRKPKMPQDWKALFKQNVDDDFKIGLQVNPGQGKGAGADKGVYLRLFADFYQSDIIIASPLGLRFVIESSQEKSFDFLSSIEVLVLHQADVMYMQNWDHVDFVLSKVNLLPTENHETDFSRVRPYFLEGQGAQHRQLIMTSSFSEPVMQSTFRACGASKAGTVRLRQVHREGTIAQVLLSVNQVYQKVPCQSFDTQDDSRFAYFCDHVLSQIDKLGQKRTLIFAPSYLHYVALRNEMMRRDLNAAYVCEYSRDTEVTRGRSRFFHGLHDILLYSGRSHFFNRYNIRGAMHIIFYSLPEYATFYPELVNMLSEAAQGGLEADTSCTVLFTRYEKMALERIVGAKRAAHMLKSAKATFMFR